MCVLVTQSCLTLCDPMDCSLAGSSVHGILQARILEWVAISFPSVIYRFSLVAQSCLTLQDPMDCSTPASLSITNSQSLLKLMSIKSVMPSNHLIPPPAFNLSHHQDLSSESVLLIRRPKYWSFSFSISPSNENLGLISFRIDWLDLLAVQGTLRSLFQHHSSKVSVLRRSAFFMVQLSHLYMTPGKTIALTRRTFVGKVTPLRFNMLSR